MADPALVPLNSTKQSMDKARMMITSGFDWADSCMGNPAIREVATEDQKQEMMDMVRDLAAADQELEARIKVVAEINTKLRKGEDVPKLQDFGNHRLPAVLDDLRKSTHEGITRYEQILDGGEAMMDEDGDGELLMTEEETPVIDRFSKMPLENAFMAPNCPSHCVFNKDSVDTMFKKRTASIQCPCCDLTIVKAEMQENKALLIKIKQAQKKLHGKKKAKGMRLD